MKILEISPAMKQDTWGWPAVINFSLGGAGVGLYLFSFAAEILQNGPLALSRTLPFGLMGPLLVVLGFLTLTVEVGRPSRGIYLLRGLANAWVSRETLFALVFVPSAAIDWLIPSFFFRLLAVSSGFLFMISQGYILYQVRAIKSWNMWTLPFFFLSSGWASGGGIFLLLAAIAGFHPTSSMIVIAVCCTGLNLIIWLICLYMPNFGFLRGDFEQIQRRSSLMRIIELGHVLSICGLLIIKVTSADILGFAAGLMTGAVGLIILCAILGQKAALMLAFSDRRAISLCIRD